MFALPCHHTPSFLAPSSPFVDMHHHASSPFGDSFFALHELQRQRQVALARQAQEEELLRRRRRFLEEQEQQRQAELACRAALIRKARREEYVYRQALARHRQAAAVKQQHRFEEEEQRVEALHQQQYRQQCSPQSLPALFDTLFGGLAREQESPVDDATPHSPADFADPPSPILSASSIASSSSSVDDSLSLTSSSSSTADRDSDADSVSTASFSSTSVEAAASLSTLSHLASSFLSRREAFIDPTTLSFQPSDGRSPSPPLAFTASNAPLLAYEDYLLSLLTQIDAVDSAGDAEVRRQRKELVRAIEGELRRVDELKELEWERQSGNGGSSGEEEAEEEDVEMSSEEEDEEAEEANEEQRAFPSFFDFSSLPANS